MFALITTNFVLNPIGFEKKIVGQNVNIYKHQITPLAINGLVTPLPCSHERASRTKFESCFASKRPGRNLPDNGISF